MEKSLHQKIQAIYPSLVDADFCPPLHIVLRNDRDERGDYIAKWTHPTLPQPTEEQLNAVT
jgi:hypothetical protein